MQAREFVEDLKTAVLKAKAEGNAHIPIDSLVDYLDSVPTATDPSPAAMEQYKAQLSAWVEEHKSRHSTDLEMFKSVITAGQGAIKTAFAMNSGAAVALLAFIGHLARFQPAQVPVLAWTLLPFTSGVFLSGLLSGTTYLSQWLYAGEKESHRKAGYALNIFAILLGLATYGCFVWGMWCAIDAFLNFEAAPSTVPDTP
ncbi:hypothetical protein GOL32_18130 [Sinorhizobium medicae]|nr:hypothetical protein [Sinorhizobium medicae]